MVFKRSKNVFFALASERSFFKILNKISKALAFLPASAKAAA